jgi:drug/metabolite transporter (DMT)-like permease
VTPVLGGLGAALAWAGATLFSTRASRGIGAAPTLAWVMLIGLVATVPLTLAAGRLDLDRAEFAWLVASGVGNVVGLMLVYSAVRAGKIGVVAPIASSEGAIAALLAVVAGEALAPGVGAALAAVAVGIVLAGMARDDVRDVRPHELRATALAVGAALVFGASLYATGRISDDVAIGYALLPARLVGVAAVTVPLALRGRLPLPRGVTWFVVAAALCEIGGFSAFLLGAREGVAVASVLASLFSPVAAVAAYAMFGERLAGRQIAGVAAIVAGVAALGVLRA